MRKTTLFLVLAVLLLGSVPALADGKFYWPEPIPPRIPYQRALLLYDGARETLILQSKYQTVGSSIDGFLGWVVPVPSVPELASMDSAQAESLFLSLSYRSQPRVTSISELLLMTGLFVAPVAAVLLLVVCGSSLFVPRMRFVRRHRPKLVVGAVVMLIFSFLCLQYFSRFTTPASRGALVVDVIKSERVGIYDVQVVKAERAPDLVQWLNEHRLQFDDTDIQVFDQYLDRGWYFVVARIDPSRKADSQESASEGLVDPLIMRFQADAPVYPLALTSTSGHETQILLYVLSRSKWQNDGRLDLQFAGQAYLNRGTRNSLYGEVEPLGFFSGLDLALPYLCRFKGTLTPDQMQEDLTLTLAGNSRFYRKHIITW
jgi:hypothetical protein